MGTGEGMDEMEFTEAESNRTISSRSISNTRMQRQRRRVSLMRRRASMTCNLDRPGLPEGWHPALEEGCGPFCESSLRTPFSNNNQCFLRLHFSRRPNNAVPRIHEVTALRQE